MIGDFRSVGINSGYAPVKRKELTAAETPTTATTPDLSGEVFVKTSDSGSSSATKPSARTSDMRQQGTAAAFQLASSGSLSSSLAGLSFSEKVEELVAEIQSKTKSPLHLMPFLAVDNDAAQKSPSAPLFISDQPLDAWKDRGASVYQDPGYPLVPKELDDDVVSLKPQSAPPEFGALERTADGRFIRDISKGLPAIPDGFGLKPENYSRMTRLLRQ